MTIFRFSFFGLACGTLVSCNSSNPDVCSSISYLDVGKANDRFVANKLPDPPEQCVHRWSYRLASASGSNIEIARAAVAACKEPIEFAAMPANRAGEPDPAAYDQAVKEVRADVFEQALFRVVQARAGKCKVE